MSAAATRATRRSRFINPLLSYLDLQLGAEHHRAIERLALLRPPVGVMAGLRLDVKHHIRAKRSQVFDNRATARHAARPVTRDVLGPSDLYHGGHRGNSQEEESFSKEFSVPSVLCASVDSASSVVKLWRLRHCAQYFSSAAINPRSRFSPYPGPYDPPRRDRMNVLVSSRGSEATLPQKAIDPWYPRNCSTFER